MKVMSPRKYLYVSATFSFLVISTVLSESETRYAKFSFKLDNQARWTFYSIPLKQCHRQCNLRNKCKSYTYNTHLKECLLSESDGTSQTVVKAAGYVLSEKRHWINIERGAGCLSCKDVCDDSNGIPCTVTGCDIPNVLDSNSYIKGNMNKIGSKVKHICNDDQRMYNVSMCLTTGQWSLGHFSCPQPIECSQLPVVQGGSFIILNGTGEGATGNVQCNGDTYRVNETMATCLSSAQWSVMTFVCWSLVLDELNSQTKKLINPSTGKFWHNDGQGDKRISSRYQSSDSFVDFLFEFQMDGSYTFEDYNTIVCDGYNTSNPYLHTGSDCRGDEYTHFYLYTDNSVILPKYHIYSKVYDRIVRLDEDNMVSTRYNKDDERAIFTFVDP